MNRTVRIDVFPESADRYRAGYAIVAIDVIRATTTAVTAVAAGRRCFPVPTVEAALSVAAVLERPLLAGELGGNMPFGFDLTNSPAVVQARNDVERPLVLLSSSGTALVDRAAGCDAVYLACLRNARVLAPYLSERHERIAVIGAGTRGEFREEDQLCCAIVAADLMERGYAPADPLTERIVDRWRNAPASSWLCSKSVDYLGRSGQLRDLGFIVTHLDDLDSVFVVEDGEVVGHRVETASTAPESPSHGGSYPE